LKSFGCESFLDFTAKGKRLNVIIFLASFTSLVETFQVKSLEGDDVNKREAEEVITATTTKSGT